MKWYPTLVCKIKLNTTGFNKNCLENTFYEFMHIVTVNVLILQFKVGHDIYTFYSNNKQFFISKGILGIIENGLYSVLLYQEGNNLHISKNFQVNYKSMFLKFKKYIQEQYESTTNIIYCNNPADLLFEYVELPKFKSIKERQEYGVNLYNEYKLTL